MTLVLENLVPISADRVRCRILREGISSEFTVRFTQLDEGIRGLEYEGMSPKETRDLSDRDEFKATHEDALGVRGRRDGNTAPAI